MVKMRIKFSLITLIAVFFCSSILYGRNFEEGVLDLITPQEAAAPDQPEGHIEAGVEEGGPIIEVVNPEYGKIYSPPLPVIVRFVPKDGQEVDLSTLKVEYMKFIPIDITERVRPYITKDGIRAEKVNIPPGIHNIRVSLSDVKGAKTRVNLYVTVAW